MKKKNDERQEPRKNEVDEEEGSELSYYATIVKRIPRPYPGTMFRRS